MSVLVILQHQKCWTCVILHVVLNTVPFWLPTRVGSVNVHVLTILEYTVYVLECCMLPVSMGMAIAVCKIHQKSESWEYHASMCVEIVAPWPEIAQTPLQAASCPPTVTVLASKTYPSISALGLFHDMGTIAIPC